MDNYYHTDIANISRSKGNQAIKVGQLIEYNMRRIVLYFFQLFFLYIVGHGILGKHVDHLKKIKTSPKNDPLDEELP